MEKRLIIAGVKHFSGVGKQSGNPYSFAKVIVLEPALVNGPVVNAAGYEAREFDAESHVLTQLQSAKFPVEVMAFLEIVGRENKISINSVKFLQPAKVAPAESKTA